MPNKLFQLSISACVCCPDLRKDTGGWSYCLRMGKDPDGTPIYYIHKHWKNQRFSDDFPPWCPLCDTDLPSRKECRGWEPPIQWRLDDD